MQCSWHRYGLAKTRQPECFLHRIRYLKLGGVLCCSRTQISRPWEGFWALVMIRSLLGQDFQSTRLKESWLLARSLVRQIEIGYFRLLPTPKSSNKQSVRRFGWCSKISTLRAMVTSDHSFVKRSTLSNSDGIRPTPLSETRFPKVSKSNAPSASWRKSGRFSFRS